MPTVPNLETPQVQQESLPGRAFPRVDDNVNSAAFGAPVAQGLEHVSDAISQEDYKEKVQNDNLRVIDANTQLEAGRNALLYGQPDKDGVRQGGAFALHGLDAINLPAKMLPGYQKIADGISQSLTPDQQQLFHGHVAAGQNELNLQLNRYEAAESDRLATQVYTNAASQAVESASVGWRDPVVVGKSRADIKALVQLQGDREGWPQEERAAQTQKLLAEMHFSVVDRMLADGNPQVALAYFVGSKAEPGIRDSRELTGQQSHQLGAAIDAAIRQQGVEIQSQVAQKVRDVRSAAINGQLIPPSSMPSDAELKLAYPNDWQREKDGIQRDVQMGSDLKSFASLTPAQIADHVLSYKPTTVSGAAEEYDRMNAASAAAQRTLAERAKDPRQYAIDNGLGSNPLDFRDAQATAAELRTRLTSTTTLSRQMGGYVPALTRQEATQLASTLEGQTPTDRLRTLGSLSTALNDDRGFQEIMRQVMPASPVTAIVGAQVSQTHPTNAPVWFDQHFAQPPANQAHILAGEQLLNPQGSEKEGGKKAFPMPAEGGVSGLREQFASKTGDLFRTRPELGEAYYTAFKSAYASLLADSGDLSGGGSNKLRDQALAMSVGNLTTFHHGSVSVPQGMDPSRFEGLMDNAVNARAINLGAPADWKDKIGGYQVREIGGLGSGKYELTNGNVPLVRPDGKGPFVVDLRNDYLPGVAHGSPEDQTRAAPDPLTPTGVDTQGNVPKAGTEPHALKPVSIPTGGKGKGAREHPSQGPAL
jgi:hypothetical protein